MSDVLKQLIERSREGDPRAVQIILLKMKPLIHRVVSKYKSRDSQDYDDLYQEASLTLVKCIEKFDLTYGEEFKPERFFSYARVSMDHASICYLQQFDVVAIPRRLWQIRNRIERENPEDVKEFCEKYDISENRFYDAKSLIATSSSSPRTVEFDAAGAEVPESLDSEFVERLVDTALSRILKDHIEDYRQYFDDKALKIFQAVYIEDRETNEIADQWDVEPGRVRYIALQTLRDVQELLLDLGVKPADFV
ncbi:sigma-70 family RNA polymerase sigma factor [Vibrio breoganii]|uniref:sigma-70 family RNA polymerase sigma factor n=2 Tax=Vibrio TaxID=662 RepID=UPI000C82EDEB|nr:sigma-70 family RNA polymerase sigma factor [Vibrio breoganii]PML12712.1 hypothetical protein BCT84_02185 [Vibrio breoganii]